MIVMQSLLQVELQVVGVAEREESLGAFRINLKALFVCLDGRGQVF